MYYCFVFFCSLPESVFHVFTECSRLVPLFMLLERLFGNLGFVFNKTLFIYGCKYSRAHQQQCTVANFITGQAKLAIWKSCRLAAEGRNVDVVLLFIALVESRIKVEHSFFQMTNNLLEFEFKWCANGALLSFSEEGGIMFNW